jgi:hypothetical protein
MAVSVIDDEAVDRGGDYAAELLNAIHEAYPQATEPLPPNAAPRPGQVTMTIHIHQLGAFYNATKSSILAKEQNLHGIRGSTKGWEPVVKAAVLADPVVAGTVYKNRPGNWSGIVNIDIEITDARPGHGAAFVIPLIVERSRQNDLGYGSARIVSNAAWSEIRPRLAACIYAAVKKLRDEQ